MTRLLLCALSLAWLAGCYNAAPWCTKQTPCTRAPSPKDSTKADTTRKS